MNDEPIEKRNMSKWVKIPLYAFGGLVVLVYGFYQMIWPSWHDTYGVESERTVLNAATGAYTEDMEWESRPKFDDMLLKTKCTEYIRIKDHKATSTYTECITPHPWGGGPGCAWWRFEGCSVF